MSFDEKLAKLREKYLDTNAGDIFDPAFRQVADTVFDKSGRRKFPYSGVSTLLDAPHELAPLGTSSRGIAA